MEEMENIVSDDCNKLNSKLAKEDSLIRLKRRWLMDLPSSRRELPRVNQMLSDDTILPEALLREGEDVSYEDIKNCVEVGFGLHRDENRANEPFVFKSSDECSKCILSLLDTMTVKGLYSLCMTLTGGKVEFEKTKYRMTKTIKQRLRKKTDTSDTLLEQLSQLVNDPNNFHESQLVATTSPEAYRDTANKVLDGLEDLSPITLYAMHSKLLGKGLIPSMWRQHQAPDVLIRSIRKKCRKMITELSKGREPAEKLASALGIASLDLKHLKNSPVAVNFRNFSPEVEALQNSIAKSIGLLNKSTTVNTTELRRLQPLLDPTAKSSSRKIRMGIRNILTDYLFECGDMDDVPDSLMKTLDVINDKTLPQSKKKRGHLSPEDLNDQMLKEVECVSRLSALVKQVVLDSLQKPEFDEDFARAYMENFEESDPSVVSDDDDNDSIHCEFDYHNLHSETESIGETTPPMSNSPVSTSHASCRSPAHSPNRSLNTPLGTRSINEMDMDEIQSHADSEIQSGQNMKRKYNSTIKLEMDSLDPDNSASMPNLFLTPLSAMDSSLKMFNTEEFKVEQTKIDSLQSGFSNAYLEMQEACDATSMVAYRFVGQKLMRLAGTELVQGDRLYLQGGASVPESSEESLESLLASKLTGMWKDVLEC